MKALADILDLALNMFILFFLVPFVIVTEWKRRKR